MAESSNSVHVDFYNRGTHYEIVGRSQDGTYTQEGYYIRNDDAVEKDNQEKAIVHAKDSIAKHNAQTSSEYNFGTYTFH